ncbi:hypothetical protein MJO28_006234 [Puccinia striiformis f. sp. tritici]|uniref:Uncharacterized protein n=1 Tax=Puccinia striiformis f. sp. tritici TaxID=168172 RepID=A0ACC0EGC9_9BASI|nr:hypothetical protein MJO28_006234 [Puccinia striiformis f. sp. tritici]
MTQSNNVPGQQSGPGNQNVPTNCTPKELKATLCVDIANFNATVAAHGGRGDKTSIRACGSDQSRGQASQFS